MNAPLPTPDEMARWDEAAIRDYGIRAEMLMENAAREALHSLAEAYGNLSGRRALVFAGSGNNGGDAFCLARHLADQGVDVTLLHTRPRGRLRGAARYHAKLAARCGVRMFPARFWRKHAPASPDIVVDGLLGTGFSGPLREDYLSLVQAVNELGSHAFVLAIDIPSGLNGLTGEAEPEAVRADLTVTFEACKLGLALPAAVPFTGRIDVSRIGIPRAVLRDHPARQRRITDGVFDILARPAPEMHKGAAGHVLVVGGARGLTGAPLLAALGALRAGAGYATVACPGAIAESVKAGRPDVMLLPLGTDPTWSPKLLEPLSSEIDRFDTVVFGPGMGRDPDAAAFFAIMTERLGKKIPLVLDADALFHLARATGTWKHLGPQTILTPHPGEMARLCNTKTSTIQRERPQRCRDLAMAHGLTVILKGAGTLVADAGGLLSVSSHAEPNLAVAGSGDVLAGMIGSLLARGLAPGDAACLAVHWHGRAGRFLAEDFPMRGNLASEIADALPHCLPTHSTT